MRRSTIPLAAAARPFTPIRLLELELSDGIDSLAMADPSAGRRYDSAVLLVRLHGEPLGTVFVPAPDGMIAPSTAAAAIDRSLGDRIADHLGRDGLSSLPETTTERPRCRADRETLLADPPLVSVVVATHDRPESLTTCLGSLMRLSYPRYEIVVVINAPPAGVRYDAVQAAFAGPPPLRWVHEDVPGACHARNRGIAVAQGELIAFCDDDVIHDPDWLTELALGFRAGPRVGCVTGLAYPQELETAPQLWFEQYGGFGAGFIPQLFDMGEHRPPDPAFPFRPATFGVGTNMAYRREVVRGLGGFDVVLGPGTPVTSGEDYALYFRTLLRGYQIAYRPSALVYHRHRRDLASLRRQVAGYAAGYAAALLSTALAHPSAALRILRWLPLGLVSFVRAKRRDQQPPGYPLDLAALELRSLAMGPALYLLGRWRAAQASTVRSKTRSASFLPPGVQG